MPEISLAEGPLFLHSRSYLFLGIVIFLTALAGFLYTRKGYNWGLDIRGGVQLTYQMQVGNMKPEDVANARDRTYKVLTLRAGKELGVIEALVAEKGNDQFVVDLPGFKDLDQAKKVMGTSAKIIFYDAKNVVTDTATYREYDTEDSKDPNNPQVIFIRKSDGSKILPGTPAYAQVIKGWSEIVSGDELKSAQMQPNPGGGSYIPEMTFRGDGIDKMRTWSEANNHRGEKLAAVLDGICISIARIQDGAVLSDNAVINGQFDTEYVRNLVDLLNSGALPVDLKILSATNIDPSIGQNALNMMLTAGVVAAIAIAVFMLVYYEFPGLIAVLALCLYILFTLTALKLIEATFSLAAIAGFVLSVGMAVDANILVFERLKEEMRAGKSLEQALELGFKRALPAIVDSNACTIITAIVLLNTGTGPVKGFATTLIIGVAISLFTAVMVTRSLLVFAIGSGLGTNKRWYGLNRQWFGESLEAGAQKKPLQIVNKAGRYFFISALTIVPGILFICLGGLKGNVEFTGGTEAIYATTLSASQITANLKQAGFPDATVIMGSNNTQRLAYITIPPNNRVNENTPNANALIAQAAGVQAADNQGIDHIGGTIQAETIRNAAYGVIYSTVAIIFYLAMRFGFALGGFVIGLRFSVSTILALLHDILVVVGLAAIMGYLLNWQVSALFISAMLTVIGFSTHDTIVIFDRIRENLRRPQPDEDVGNLINRSITQSVARSINTSMTVIATLAILIAVGSATPELKLFNAAMLVGIISGTYSSIFNASPILYLWDKAIQKKSPENTLLGIAHASRVKIKPLTTAAPVPTSTNGPTAPGQATPGYSQVKRRRASDVEKSKRSIDDDDDV